MAGVHVITCDHYGGCHRSVKGQDAALAMALAYSGGWRKAAGKDYCPYHHHIGLCEKGEEVDQGIQDLMVMTRPADDSKGGD
jgi:hypothetical protein